MSENHNDDKTRTHVVLTKGTMVSHYRIIEKIGAGGMGEVYLAEDTELKRQVALKFLPPHLCQDEDCRARFKREAQAVAKLKHPNIVTIYEVSEFQGRPFFAMECCEGQSLHDLIKEQKLNLDEIVGLTIRICEGLQEAHEAGIIHRDIKPSNIILDKKGRPKILDFGLAAVKGMDKLTKTGSTLGTTGYMSPEQARGQKVDQRSDLFSLGVVLYKMVTGRRPFRGEDEAATLHAVIYETPQPLARFCKDVPDDLQRVVTKLLEKDPALRYQSAAGVVSDLKPLATSGPRPVTVSARVSRAKKLRWAAALSLLIIAAVSIGFVLKHFLAPGELRAKSLAVLFFENLGTEDESYLASGLAEDLAIKLRNIAGFRVASSADIRRLSKKDLLAKDVASHLGVQYALDGSLLRHGERIRVNVELIDEKTGEVIWSEQFNREFTEVFQFIDEISHKIAQALEVHLIPAEQLALKEKPTDDPEAYDHYLKGRHYYYRVTFRDNELAEREFERALQLDPDYPLALAGLADVYVQRYKERFDYDEYWLDSSKVLIDRALALDPGLAEAYESRAEVLLEEDNITGAREAAEKARQLRPDWDEPYVHLGNIYKQRGERSKALAMFDTALSIRPSVDALCGNGNILQIRGQMDSARALYQAALELNPDHDRPYLELGWLHEELYEGEETERVYRRAIEVRPDHATAYQEISYRLYYRGNIQEGEELLRGFVERFPYNWDGYEALYWYLRYRGDYSAAFEIIEEAVRRNPERVWPYLFLAYSYAKKMSLDSESDEAMAASEKAVLAVDRALTLRPNSGRVLEWAGEVYIDLNRLDEAMDYFDRATELRPGSSDLLSAIAWKLTIISEYERAVEFARKAVEQSPGRRKYYSDLRFPLVFLNRWQEYFDIIQQAAREYGDDPDFLQDLSREQRYAGQFEEAINTSQRALALKRTSFWGGSATLGITLWLSGDTEGALDRLREEKESYEPAYWIVAILKSEGRFGEIEQYLESIKEKTPMRMSGIDYWADVASSYYMSMRRFDNALSALAEERQSGEETFSIQNTMLMAKCYRQKGVIDSARHLLEELVDLSTGVDRPNVFVQLALLQVIGARDLKAALELAERASAEQTNSMYDYVSEPLLRLQYASGQTDDVVKTLQEMGFPWLGSTRYRKAQLAAVTCSSGASAYFEEVISSLTRLTRGEHNWGDVGSASAFLALALARAGKPVEAAREIKRAIKLEPEREDITYNAACAYSLMGDTALALQWLETAVERGHLELWWARVDPDLNPLRELPRFKEIMNDWDRRIQTLLE